MTDKEIIEIIRAYALQKQYIKELKREIERIKENEQRRNGQADRRKQKS